MEIHVLLVLHWNWLALHALVEKQLKSLQNLCDHYNAPNVIKCSATTIRSIRGVYWGCVWWSEYSTRPYCGQLMCVYWLKYSTLLAYIILLEVVVDGLLRGKHVPLFIISSFDFEPIRRFMLTLTTCLFIEFTCEIYGFATSLCSTSWGD